MPPIIAAIALVITDFAAAFGIALVDTAAFAIANVLLSIGASLVLGSVSKLLKKSPNASSLASQLQSRTITTRQSISPWRVMYGSNRVGGIITFLHTTGTKNEKLHIVITLAGHEVNAIPAMYFDGVAVPLDGSGNATGNFAGFVHAEFNLGTQIQASFPGLVAAAPAFWTSAHRQFGRAGVYVQLTWDQNKFPNGVPNITFDVQGRKVYDPRSGTIAYSSNAALCIADYLNNASFGLVAQTKYPITAAMLTASTLDSFVAANLVDGDITTIGFDTNSPTAVGSSLNVDLGSGNPQEFRRFRIYTSAVGAFVWAWDIKFSDDNITYTTAASTFIPHATGWNEVELAPNGAHRYWQIKATAMQVGVAVEEIEFYTSDVDTTQLISAANTCDEAVTLAAGGTQPRFTVDGSFDTSNTPADVIGGLNSAMAGSICYIAGKWGIYPGIWRAPTLSFSDADLRGPLTVQTRLSHRDLYNGVKGTYISPLNEWQAAAYPPFQDPSALQEDSNEALWLDVELPFTIDGIRAQRISKIALRRVRHQITVQAQFKLTAYVTQPLDVIQFSHPRFGWTNKTFEVTACTLGYIPDKDGANAVCVDLTLREADSTIYDWSTADEQSLLTPPVPTLPNNGFCQPPTGLTVSPTEITRTVDGVKMNFIQVSWTAPADQFVTNGGAIRVQYKKHTDTNWTDIGKQPGNSVTALAGPVIDGIQYDIQVWAENRSGVSSTVVSASATPTGTAVTLNTIADGTSRYARTAGNSSYRPLSNPLTAHDAGSNVTVTIAAFTMRYSDLDVSVSTGSIGSLSYATGYYIYYDDATRAGGGVTFGATTTKETALNGAGRMFVGSIKTPASGAPDTAGNNDGGVGAQFGGLATSIPITVINPGIGGDQTFGSPTNAFDASYTTAASAALSNTSPGTADCSWTGFTSPVAATPTALNLKITSDLTNTGIGASIEKLSYSLDGGSTFTDIYSLSNSNRAKTTDIVSLATSQDISKIVVRAQIQHTGASGSVTQNVYDIRLEISV